VGEGHRELAPRNPGGPLFARTRLAVKKAGRDLEARVSTQPLCRDLIDSNCGSVRVSGTAEIFDVMDIQQAAFVPKPTTVLAS